MSRLQAVLQLALGFLLQLVLSGVSTVRIILSPRPRIQPVLVRFAFAPMSEGGAALLAAMVTLTPGTTVVDIDMVSRTMLVHLLDGRNEAASLAIIRRYFEGPVATLFGRQP